MPLPRVERGLANRRSLLIVVSEPSANAAQRCRAGRYPPARNSRSAALNDTSWYADARAISVHTEEVNRSRSAVSGLRRALLRDGPGGGTKVGVTRGAGIPSRRHRGVANLGPGSSSFSASGAPAGP